MLCLVSIFTLAVPGLALAEDVVEDAIPLYSEYSTATEDSSVFKSASGEYVMKIDNTNEYIPVGRLDIELADEKQVNMLLTMDNLEDETKQYIKKLSEKAQNEPENAGMVVTLFSQDLLEQDTLTQVYSAQASSTVYTTYNGMAMKMDIVSIYNTWTGYYFNKQGSTAKAVAQAVYEITMMAGGAISSVISLGASALSIYEAGVGATVNETSAADFTQMNLYYSGSTRMTYAAPYDYWYLGYVSQEVTVKQVDIYQQFKVNSTSKENHSYLYPNITVTSPNFDSPWKMAYLNFSTGVLKEMVTYKINGTSWSFDI